MYTKAHLVVPTVAASILEDYPHGMLLRGFRLPPERVRVGLEQLARKYGSIEGLRGY